MKRSNLILTSFLGIALLYACSDSEKSHERSDATDSPKTDAVQEEAMTRMIDSENSVVKWKGSMLGMYSHSGTIAIRKGKLETTGDQITGGEVIIDMNTIAPTDENYSSEKPKEKLVGHLSSPDFFDVANHPSAEFRITGHTGNKITGKLTVRGNTHEETIESVVFNPDSSIASGQLTFDRTKYDVAFQHPAQEMVISNDIELDIALKLK